MQVYWYDFLFEENNARVYWNYRFKLKNLQWRQKYSQWTIVHLLGVGTYLFIKISLLLFTKTKKRIELESIVRFDLWFIFKCSLFWDSLALKYPVQVFWTFFRITAFCPFKLVFYSVNLSLWLVEYWVFRFDLITLVPYHH